VHGLGGTSNFYQVQAEARAERFQVIRVDSAGAGRSPVVDGITIESHADDLAAILDGLGVDSAAVVGHSMGTLVSPRPSAACSLTPRRCHRTHTGTLLRGGTPLP
jgi:3-oxoadipate enol-lactonase